MYEEAVHEVPQNVLALMKSQRRVRGVVTCTEHGRCELRSDWGRFLFDRRSVKPNKNHPERDPQVGDACEFRLSHHFPPTAVSIRISVPKKHNAHTMQTCYSLLEETCGGVASLLYQLEGSELRHTICVLYLLSRVLDCVQESNLKNKVQLLQSSLDSLPESNLVYTLSGSDKKLVASLPEIYNMIASLPAPYQEAVMDATLARGMALGQEGNGREACADIDEFNRVCGAVGGVLCEGMAKVFGVQVGALDLQQAGSMGVFITKCHAIRSQSMGVGVQWPADLTAQDPVSAVNYMICDAMGHIPDCLAYLKSLQYDVHVYRFAAVPFLLAACTLFKVWGARVPHRATSIGREESMRIVNLQTPTDFLTQFVSALQTFKHAALRRGHPHFDEATVRISLLETLVA